MNKNDILFEEELKKCLTHGRTVHEAFMRKMAIRQYEQSVITNELLRELLLNSDIAQKDFRLENMAWPAAKITLQYMNNLLLIYNNKNKGNIWMESHKQFIF